MITQLAHILIGVLAGAWLSVFCFFMLSRKLAQNHLQSTMRVGLNEPTFTLRAQDCLAPALVLMWADLALSHGLPEPKYQQAVALAEQMKEWQRLYGSKYPS